jgi:hypothetical protein
VPLKDGANHFGRRAEDRLPPGPNSTVSSHFYAHDGYVARLSIIPSFMRICAAVLVGGSGGLYSWLINRSLTVRLILSTFRHNVCVRSEKNGEKDDRRRVDVRSCRGTSQLRGGPAMTALHALPSYIILVSY